MQAATLTKNCVNKCLDKIIQDIRKNDSGYLYVMSNSIRPGWLKIGMTRRVPDLRLHEANYSNLATWILPFPYAKQKAFYRMEYAKYVASPLQKERTLHFLLHNKRIDIKREFFEVTLNEIMPYFKLIDGHDWTRARHYFAHGQSIRSTIDEDVWIGKYDLGKNTIVCDGIHYAGYCPLTQFAEAHAEKHHEKNIDAWKHCETLINGQWVSADKVTTECEQYWTNE